MHLKTLALCAVLLLTLPAFADDTSTRKTAALDVLIEEALGIQAPDRDEAETHLSLAELQKLIVAEQPLVTLQPRGDDAFSFVKDRRFECNQGAFCRYKTDPVCGREGFCNLTSNCCMCF